MMMHLESRLPEYPEDLTVDVVERVGECRLVFRGEIDIMTVHLLVASIREAIEESEGAIVVDLHAVGFIDSSGIYGLLVAHEHAAELGREMMLVTGPPVDTVIEILELRHRFQYSDPTN